MEHKELGTICDEHEDDIQDLIEFYRTVAGGNLHILVLVTMNWAQDVSEILIKKRIF